jgi:cysteine desulfuration protein SufE
MTGVPPLEEIMETFEAFDDWENRFEYLLDLGKTLPDMPASERTDDVRVHGCQAQVWLRLGVTDGTEPRVWIVAASDAHIVQGLIAIVISIFGGKKPDEVIATDAEAVFRSLDLDSHLSGTRRNGLAAMIARVRALAEAAAAKGGLA